MRRHDFSSQRRALPIILSYIVDWVVVIIIAVIGGLFSLITGNHRPFSLIDPSLAFPYVLDPKVSTTVLFIISLVAPAIIIVLTCLLLVPSPPPPPASSVTTPTTKSRSSYRKWFAKLWESHISLLGLCLAYALTFLFTQGMKSLFGKPRPDLLSRCDPDLSNIASYVVGGVGDGVPEGNFLVSGAICKQTDKGILNDGFSSFPSGHASFSAAGLVYLSLFFCARLRFAIPVLLPPTPISHRPTTTSTGRNSQSYLSLSSSSSSPPPLYLLPLPLIPFALSVYISSTRYSDFRHHGFDIIFGFLMGFAFAWASFRMYHAPVRRGGGLGWGPRGVGMAWGQRIGVEGGNGGNGEYNGGVGEGLREEKRENGDMDLEAGKGHGVNGAGMGGGSSSTAVQSSGSHV